MHINASYNTKSQDEYNKIFEILITLYLQICTYFSIVAIRGAYLPLYFALD